MTLQLFLVSYCAAVPSTPTQHYEDYSVDELRSVVLRLYKKFSTERHQNGTLKATDYEINSLNELIELHNQRSTTETRSSMFDGNIFEFHFLKMRIHRCIHALTVRTLYTLGIISIPQIPDHGEVNYDSRVRNVLDHIIAISPRLNFLSNFIGVSPMNQNDPPFDDTAELEEGNCFAFEFFTPEIENLKKRPEHDFYVSDLFKKTIYKNVVCNRAFPDLPTIYLNSSTVVYMHNPPKTNVSFIEESCGWIFKVSVSIFKYITPWGSEWIYVIIHTQGSWGIHSIHTTVPAVR